MVNFYVNKIKNEVKNPATGEVWKVEDVPKLWRGKVEAALQE